MIFGEGEEVNALAKITILILKYENVLFEPNHGMKANFPKYKYGLKCFHCPQWLLM